MAKQKKVMYDDWELGTPKEYRNTILDLNNKPVKVKPKAINTKTNKVYKDVNNALSSANVRNNIKKASDKKDLAPTVANANRINKEKELKQQLHMIKNKDKIQSNIGKIVQKESDDRNKKSRIAIKDNAQSFVNKFTEPIGEHIDIRSFVPGSNYNKKQAEKLKKDLAEVERKKASGELKKEKYNIGKEFKNTIVRAKENAKENKTLITKQNDKAPVGAIAGEIALLALPYAKAEKTIRGAKALKGLSGTGKKLASSVGAGAVVEGAYSKLKGDDNETALKKAAIGGAFGAGAVGVEKVGGKIIRRLADNKSAKSIIKKADDIVSKTDDIKAVSNKNISNKGNVSIKAKTPPQVNENGYTYKLVDVDSVKPKDIATKDMRKVNAISKNIDGKKVGISDTLDDGAPIIDDIGNVLNGNKRATAIKAANNANGKSAKEYRKYIRENYKELGLTRQEVKELNRTKMLVRVENKPIPKNKGEEHAQSILKRLHDGENVKVDSKNKEFSVTDIVNRITKGENVEIVKSDIPNNVANRIVKQADDIAQNIGKVNGKKSSKSSLSDFNNNASKKVSDKVKSLTQRNVASKKGNHLDYKTIDDTTSVENIKKILKNHISKHSSEKKRTWKIKDMAGDKIKKLYRANVDKGYGITDFSIAVGDEKLNMSRVNRNNVGGSVDSALEYKITGITGEIKGDSLKDVVSKIKPHEQEDWNLYMASKHNIDRMAQGKPVFGENITSEISQKVIKDLEKKYPHFIESSKKMNTYNKNLMDWAVDGDMISRENVDLMEEMYENYVPTRRVGKESANKAGGGSPSLFKNATGSDKQIYDITEQMAIKTDQIMRASKKNKLLNDISQLHIANPEKTYKYVKSVRDLEVDKEAMFKEMLEYPDKLVENVGDGWHKIRFFDKGKPKEMVISDAIFDDFKYIEDEIGNVLNVIRDKVTNPMKSATTGLNPTFSLRNGIRDTTTALIQSTDSVAFLKNIKPAIIEMKNDGEIFQQFLSSGVMKSGLMQETRKGAINGLQKTTKYNLIKGKNVATKALDKYRDIIGSTEFFPRYLEYYTSIKKFGNTAEGRLMASYNAGEITTNFNRYGAMGKKIDAVVPYWNAAIQGTANTVRNVIRNPKRTLAKGFGAYGLVGVTLDQINGHFFNEDYHKLPDWEKKSYFHLPSGEGKFVRIPKAHTYGTIIVSGMEAVAAKVTRGEDLTLSGAFDGIREALPSDPVTGNVGKVIFDVSMLGMNKDYDVMDWRGNPVIPKGLKMAGGAKSDMYTNQTSVISKEVSKAIFEFSKGKVDVSPMIFDHFFKSYAGFIGEELLPQKGRIHNDNKILETAYNAPIVRTLIRKFNVDTAYTNKYVGKFYDLANDHYKLRSFTDDDKKYINKTKKDISTINKKIKELESRVDSNNYFVQRDIRNYKLEINRLAEDTVKKYKNKK